MEHELSTKHAGLTYSLWRRLSVECLEIIGNWLKYCFQLRDFNDKILSLLYHTGTIQYVTCVSRINNFLQLIITVLWRMKQQRQHCDVKYNLHLKI